MFDPEKYREVLSDALYDLAILAGDTPSGSYVSWQDVAGTAAVNLNRLASMLTEARLGAGSHPVLFASPEEILDRMM